MSDDPLTEIHGVGPETANQIREVVGDNSEAREALAEALDYLEADNPDYAEKFVRQAYEEL